MSEPEYRQRGRPPLRAGHRTLSVSVRMPDDEFDAIARAALKHDTSCSKIVRCAISRMLNTHNTKENQS
jgi:hypothetical protein